MDGWKQINGALHMDGDHASGVFCASWLQERLLGDRVG